MNPQFLAVMSHNVTYTQEVLESITYTHDYWIFLAPLLLHAADVITGWIQATINSKWDSTKMRYGIMRKAGMMIIVILAYCFEYAIEAVRQAHVATFLSVCIVVMEVVSVFENLDQAGVPIPGPIKRRLKKARKDIENEENDLDKREQ